MLHVYSDRTPAAPQTVKRKKLGILTEKTNVHHTATAKRHAAAKPLALPKKPALADEQLASIEYMPPNSLHARKQPAAAIERLIACFRCRLPPRLPAVHPQARARIPIHFARDPHAAARISDAAQQCCAG